MSTHVFICALLAGMPFTLALQQDRSGSTMPRKGDTITVRGCLRGGAVESTEVTSGETPVPLADNLTFRLDGDKNLLKDLKKKHDAHLVSATGVLKTDLSQRGPDTMAKVGNVRIGIGAPSTNPASAEAGNRRFIPVLDVKSFDGSATSCGR
jgi:hypothetical protein